MSQEAGILTRTEIDQIIPHFAVGPDVTVLSVYRDGQLYSVGDEGLEITDFATLAGPLLRYVIEERLAGR